MSNIILQEIFTEHVDSDRSGEVSHDEFASWLQERDDEEEEEEESGVKKKKKKKKFATKATFERYIRVLKFFIFSSISQ